MWENIQQDISDKTILNPYTTVKTVRLSWFKKVAIAASITLVSALAILYYTQKKTTPERFTISKEKDIAPGTNSAFLILADGKRVDLSKTNNGLLTTESGIEIIKKKNGELIYQAVSAHTKSNFTNTIETPKGGQYAIVLPDGSKVWLNAASSLTYPTTFSDTERRVTLKGEGYFEIAHVMDKSGKSRLPFVVATTDGRNAGQEIKVLGTHFNINSYPDEPLVRTTLLEGSIAVSTSAGKSVTLKPGQQSAFNGTNLQVSDADTDMAVAWKNGDFVFREDLNSAMRKVARWYDVDVIYTDSAPKKLMLGGWMSRETNISDVLDHIQATGKVHFTIAGRRVIVSE